MDDKEQNDSPTQQPPLIGIPKKIKKAWRMGKDVMDHVERMASTGLLQKDICHILGMSRDMMNTYPNLLAAYHRGRAKGVGDVAKSCFNQATSEKCFEATKFFLKARGGWKDQEAPVQLNFMKAVLGHTDVDSMSKEDLGSLIEQAMQSRGYEVTKKETGHE